MTAASRPDTRHKSQLEAECLKVLKTVAGRLEWRLAGAYSNNCLSETRRDFLLLTGQDSSVPPGITPCARWWLKHQEVKMLVSTLYRNEKKVTHSQTHAYIHPSREWRLGSLHSFCVFAVRTARLVLSKQTRVKWGPNGPSVLVLKPPTVQCRYLSVIGWRRWRWWPGQQGQGYQTRKAFLFRRRGPAAVNPPSSPPTVATPERQVVWSRTGKGCLSGGYRGVL